MLKFTRKKIIRLLNIFAIVIFSGSLASNSEGNIKCISLNNWPCQARPILADINSNETPFYSFSFSVNNCGTSGNTIDDPHAQFYVPNKVKNVNGTVFNLMSGINEKRFLAQHGSCESKCGLNESKNGIKN